jgi:hypothetical protein
MGSNRNKKCGSTPFFRYPLRWLPAYICKDKVMSREQKSNKETKKVPALTAKEKKAAKKAKKNERGRLGA